MSWNRTLLIVDDEANTLEGYRDYLSVAESTAPVRKSSRMPSPQGTSTNSKDPFHLILASSGPEALEKAQAHWATGGVIAGGFFDVKLEGSLDGIDVLRELWKHDPRMHACIVTAFHDRNIDELDTLFGASFSHQWDYINKPFTKSEIIQKARQMVASWNVKEDLNSTQRQLMQSEKLAAIGQIARGIGHEFGNILLRIMGKADLGLRETDLQKAHEHFQIILQASERASVIVRNLQSFSRETPSKTAFNIKDIVSESLSLIKHELIKASIHVDNTLEKQTLPDITGDRGAIAQVVLNLLINSMHALERAETKEIRIQAQKLSKEHIEGIEVSIEDSGSGISEETLPKVFETAFSTKGQRGSGLGLSISRNIVLQHKGTLEATGKGPLGGALFRFWIPLLPASS